jgi:hypothetical protein
MGVSGCGDGVPGRLGEGMNGDLNAECTEFAEGTEGRMGKDRSAWRTARAETDETRMHPEW